MGTCSPGELVTINGIVKASNLEESGSGKTNRDKATYVMYINVNSISSRTNSTNYTTTPNKNKDSTLSTSSADLSTSSNNNNTTSSRSSSSSSSNELEFSKIDLEFFNTIKDNNYPFKTIVNSLCPSIFGHELVKAGLVLGLFGGSKKSNDANDVAVRSDVHVLVVGDPGLGKVSNLESFKPFLDILKKKLKKIQK